MLIDNLLIQRVFTFVCNNICSQQICGEFLILIDCSITEFWEFMLLLGDFPI